MSRKSRGCDYERRLVHLLQSLGFHAVRVAGSGCMKYPSPDILASNKSRLLAFEVKSSQTGSVYLDESDVAELLEFSNGFGCAAWFAVHLIGKGWFFKRAEELRELKVVKIDESNAVKQF